MTDEKIVLGSGKLYIMAYTGSIPADATIETDANLIGYIQGGATLTYTPSFYEAKDDLGYVAKKIITEEAVVLKSGIMTWNASTLQKLSSTARVTTTASLRTVKIGGLHNYDGAKYVIRFLHEDADGDIRVTVVGSNEAGFELSFAKDKETVINAEFKAFPQDSDGTLVEYKEEIITPSYECNMNSFAIGTAAGTITNNAIAVTVPHGTSVTALVASFTVSSGATVKVGTTAQVSGTTANNFTSPVSYVVTAQDGSTSKTYVVTVTVAEE